MRQLHWGLHPAGVTKFWIHCTNFLAVFVSVPVGFVPEPFAEAYDFLTAFAAVPVRFAPESLYIILASVHQGFESVRWKQHSCVHYTLIHPGGRRKDMCSCLFVSPVLFSGISAVHFLGPLLCREKYILFRGPSRYHDLSPLFVNFCICAWLGICS